MAHTELKQKIARKYYLLIYFIFSSSYTSVPFTLRNWDALVSKVRGCWLDE